MLGLGNSIILPPSIKGKYDNDYSYYTNHSADGGMMAGSSMGTLFRDDWTFSGWFKFLDGQTNPPNVMFGAKESNSNRILVETNKLGSVIQVMFVANGDTAAVSTDGNTWGDGATGWNHVCVVCNKVPGSHVEIAVYINGTKPSQTTASTVTPANMGLFASSTNIAIGGSNDGGMIGGLRGYMDEIAFFDSAFSDSQAADLYNNGTPTDLTSLSPVHWYTFNGQNANDSGSEGVNGTESDGVTYSSDVPG